MRISVPQELCQGHAQCAMVAPDLYVLDDDGYASSEMDGVEVPAGLEAQAERGALACPERAISLVAVDVG